MGSGSRGAAQWMAGVAQKRQWDEAIELAKNFGLYGARIIANSLHDLGESIKNAAENIASAPEELLSKQYKTIASALLETSIVNYWERLAQGCKTDGKEDLCKYFRKEGQAPCIDPHSKLRCPIYLATGSPMCANRPMYARVRGIKSLSIEKVDDLELQIEFLVHLLFTLEPNHPSNQYIRDIDVLKSLKEKWGEMNIGGPMFLEDPSNFVFLGFSQIGWVEREQLKKSWSSLDGRERKWANIDRSPKDCTHNRWWRDDDCDGNEIHQCMYCGLTVIANKKYGYRDEFGG